MRWSVLRASVLAGCGLLGALASHAAFALIERAGALGSGYEHRVHASVAPAACGVLLFGCIALALYAIQVIDGGRRSRILAEARAFGSGPALGPLLAVVVLSLAGLVGMEAFEGHFSEALGSIPVLGGALVALLAVCIGATARAFARWIAGATEYLVAFAGARLRRRRLVAARYRCRSLAALHVRRLEELVRIGGDRAPPLSLA